MCKGLRQAWCVCKCTFTSIGSIEEGGGLDGFMDFFHEIGVGWGNLLLFTLHITFYATPPDVVAPARVIGLASVGFFLPSSAPPIDEAEDRTELTLRRPREALEGLDRFACRS